jgi:hypothetical protein
MSPLSSIAASWPKALPWLSALGVAILLGGIVLHLPALFVIPFRRGRVPAS